MLYLLFYLQLNKDSQDFRKSVNQRSNLGYDYLDFVFERAAKSANYKFSKSCLNFAQVCSKTSMKKLLMHFKQKNVLTSVRSKLDLEAKK